MIAAPTKKQLFNLRLMILIGVCCMLFFLNSLFNKAVIGYRPLYYLLIITFVYTSFKILYEWYHYWSIKVPPTPAIVKNYSVDIFTTFFSGEPYEMIVETLEAIQAITYPHQTYLCDEADDPYLKEVCKQLGVHHVTRTNKIDAKAGNINNALKQSNGELCVVLDPDHVPFPNFLDPIVSHFNNPEIGFVQIVQAYSNQDQGWVAKGAAQQTYQFYGPMMMTMNAYGTVQAIGANCTFRRTALESIGGHAAGLAEDMHTAMQLHAKGWKSVYVPAVLARGLVPATISAYYKQQLKWSRGVFELLVTSYISLFTKFTWRQKLHYGLIPLFYLSGFIYLINFLIPIASLFADVYPLYMDFSTFAIISLPFITSVILIRHYVQRWVTEDNERGFHVIGGLLIIGTWWVFIVGFIYTIIRKKVPYIPTPKDISEENNLAINIPNICILIISITAIAYGLYNDWNPFTFIMAGICSVNCFFMVFMLMASEQLKFRSSQNRYKNLFIVLDNISLLKKRFWLLRRRVYSGMRSAGLMLIVLTICFSFYAIKLSDREYSKPVIIGKQNIFLSGIFAPSQADGGSTPIDTVKAYQSKYKLHFDIVSFYIPWGDEQKCFVPEKAMQDVYKNNSVPMITWEPWETLFAKGDDAGQPYNEKHVFANIVKGRFDKYIHSVALQMKALRRPVFLRFAHEADNPFYPWSATGGNTPTEFKAAWKYIHDAFLKDNVYNVIWVWNPWKADAAANYFPGKNYVDWIGITGLNYGVYNPDKKSYSFEQIFNPFHKLPVIRSGIPVMIAEMGTLQQNGNQQEWLNNSVKVMKKSFPEIKGFVLFNSGFDKNMPDGSTGTLNWRTARVNGLSQLLNTSKKTKLIGTPAQPITSMANSNLSGNISFAFTRGVIYTKGQNWYGNTYALTKKIITADFTSIKQAGINTVRLYGPNVYDRTTFKIAHEQGLKIHYSFWVPDPRVFINDPSYLAALAEKIKKTVNENRNNKDIVSWNIGNNTVQQLADYYYKPNLFYQQQAYISWLRQLVSYIKAVDPGRVVTTDVLVSPTLKETVAMLHDGVPQIDSYGLMLNDLKDTAQIKLLNQPYYFSNVDTKLYFKLPHNNAGVFIGNWQDQQTASTVTFNGLKDIWGRNKSEFYQLVNNWDKKVAYINLPEIKILRPSLTTEPGLTLPYYALVNKNKNWHLAQYLPSDLNFEWYQVKTDGWGNPVAIKFLSKGAMLNYTIPDNPANYRLYLIGSKGNNITTALSILNIPM
jgi:cellulose synthase (UDP-forming)